jgi:hypothetical protein
MAQTNRPPAGRRSVRYYYKPTDGAGAFIHDPSAFHNNTVLELARIYPAVHLVSRNPEFDPLENDFLV